MISNPAISNLTHHRRMFAVYDQLPAVIKTWQANRESEQRNGIYAQRQALPIPYKRSTPVPEVVIKSPEFVSYLAHKLKSDQLISIFANFWTRSRKVFEFHPSLTSVLRDAEVSDVPWSEILLPYEIFYLSFPHADNPRFCVDGTEYIIDGTYVKNITGSPISGDKKGIALYITAHPTKTSIESLVAKDDRDRAMVYLCSTLFANESDTVADALANGSMHAASHAAKMDQMAQDQTSKLAVQADDDDDTPVFCCHNRNFHSQTSDVIEAVLPLIINSIFYLTQRPQDSTENMDPLVPSEWLEELNSAKNEKQRRIPEAKMRDHGFTTITFVVNPEVADYYVRTDNEGSGTVRPHPRKAHWRHVAVGPGRIGRRRTFIHFCFVNAEKGSTVFGGTTIKVNPSDPID